MIISNHTRYINRKNSTEENKLDKGNLVAARGKFTFLSVKEVYRKLSKIARFKLCHWFKCNSETDLLKYQKSHTGNVCTNNRLEKDMFHNIKIPHSIRHDLCCYRNCKCHRIGINIITIKQSERRMQI